MAYRKARYRDSFEKLRSTVDVRSPHIKQQITVIGVICYHTESLRYSRHIRSHERLFPDIRSKFWQLATAMGKATTVASGKMIGI
jgi:hypothetical protein